MEYVVIVDERGRLVLPVEVRRKLGIKGRRRLLLRVKGDSVVELVVLDRLYGDVVRVFEERFRGWREEDHEASKLLLRMMGRGDS